MKIRLSILLLSLLTTAGLALAGNWTPVPVRSVDPNANGLHSISAVSDSDIWTVGQYHNTPTTYDTLIEHGKGSKWKVVSSPNAGAGYNLLYGVAAVASDDVWAVGDADSGSAETLIEHWDGVSWQIIPSPNVTGSGNILRAVQAVASNDVWAVGYFHRSEFYESCADAALERGELEHRSDASGGECDSFRSGCGE